MKKLAITSTAAALATAFVVSAAPALADAVLDSKVKDTLAECQNISTACAASTKNALGVLVFPSVLQADLLIGGAGGKGALVENGIITGYYNIGAVTGGLQAGIQNSSQVYAFRNAEALAELKDSPSWNVGATAGVTVMQTDATAREQVDNVQVYVFDASGLHAGIALDVFNIWKADSGRSQP